MRKERAGRTKVVKRRMGRCIVDAEGGCGWDDIRLTSEAIKGL